MTRILKSHLQEFISSAHAAICHFMVKKKVQNEKICQLSFLKKYHAVFSKGKLELCQYPFKVVSKLLAAKLRT